MITRMILMRIWCWQWAQKPKSGPFRVHPYFLKCDNNKNNVYENAKINTTSG